MAIIILMGDFQKTITSLQVIISGKVQGVYYRVFAEREAQKLQLCGYVKNLPDRSVEVYAEGSKPALEKLLERLNEGPPGARIDFIKITWLENAAKYSSFGIVN